MTEHNRIWLTTPCTRQKRCLCFLRFLFFAAACHREVSLKQHTECSVVTLTYRQKRKSNGHIRRPWRVGGDKYKYLHSVMGKERLRYGIQLRYGLHSIKGTERLRTE